MQLLKCSKLKVFNSTKTLKGKKKKKKKRKKQTLHNLAANLT